MIEVLSALTNACFPGLFWMYIATYVTFMGVIALALPRLLARLPREPQECQGLGKEPE